MNTSNRLPESYQHGVYKNTPDTVKHQIQQAENPTPAKVTSTEALRIVNVILLDYLTSEMALKEPRIGRTEPNIPIDDNCTDDELHFGIWGGCKDCDSEGNEIDDSNAIHTSSRRRWAATALERFDLGTSDVDRQEGNDGDNADAVEAEETSQADDGLTQTLEDWRYSTRECEDWTLYFRPVKYNNGEANAMASDISLAKTVL